MAPRKLVAGNWKMNGLRADLVEVDALAARPALKTEVMICPPATLLWKMAEQVKGSAVKIGGQDCHTLASGAHTGDISARAIADTGAVAIIVGHSERRTDHAESSETVAAKAEAAFSAGLKAIICIGETEAQRENGETLELITEQLAASVPANATAENTIIAYEPVWAIGTGKVPTAEQIAEVHALMRKTLSDRFADGADFTLLYGGSVKGSNAKEIFAIANVDGALVGGASLKAMDFIPIIDALDAS